MSNAHVISGIDSSNLLSGYGVVLSRTTEDGSYNRNIGLIGNLTINDGRPVTMQGEIGSKALFALINEGQKSMSFNRMIPFPVETSEEAGTDTPISSILAALYYPELVEAGIEIPVLMFDIEQHEVFRKPIDLTLTFLDEITATEIARILLKNASVAGANISIGAGSQMSMEPTQISWEETIELQVEAGDGNATAVEKKEQ